MTGIGAAHSGQRAVCECESCTGEGGQKCPHGSWRHPRCYLCLTDAIDTALAELSEARPEAAIATLEEAVTFAY